MDNKRIKNDEEDSMKLFPADRNELMPLKMKDQEKDQMEDQKDMASMAEGIERFGLYQLSVFSILSFPLLLSAGATLSYVFTAGEVKYRCLVPECETLLNATFDPPWVSYSAPATDGRLATCTRYEVQNTTDGICSSSSFTNITRECDSWVFDPNESTVLSEWNITCNSNQWKLTLVGTINNVGQFVGLIFAGYISDRYGRRTILTLATFLSGISGLVHSFSVSYSMFVICEFFDATASAGLYSAGFILGMEMVGVRNRVLGGTITCCMFAIGEILLGLLAMWLRSWRALLRVIYTPALLAVLLPCLIPESVRWLLANGKTEKVEKLYRKMAHMNGLQVTDQAMTMFKELNVVKPEKRDHLVVAETRSPFMQVLTSSVILIRLLTCSFCWLTNTFVYYGLSLNSVAFAGDKYMNFVLVAVVEIPAYFLTWILTDHIGRKPTLCGSFLISGVLCLAIQFVPAGQWSYVPLILYMGGKWCITMAFSAVYVYTAEMFPTNLRHSLLGICSMTGRVGSILAPQTPLLAHIMAELPLILFGTMGIFAGFLSLIFPETLGTKLPDTVWEAENIGKVQTKQNPQNSSPS